MTTTRTRARDSDRTATCDHLDVAFAEGQIDGSEHRERTAAALRARSVGELSALVADLQRGPRPDPPPAAARPPRRRSPADAAVALVVVLVVLAVVGALTLVGSAFVRRAADHGVPSPSGGTAPGARVVAPVDLHSEAGWRRMVDDLVAARGSAQVYDLVLYPGYAVLELPVPGEPARAHRVSYRGGVGTPDATTLDPEDPAVDLAGVDPRPLLALLAGVDRSVGVRDADSRYLAVDTDPEEGTTVRLYASNAYSESGHVAARPDGTVLAVHPHEP
ncbi:DUF1707 SHOCT-like domain-containing protein [Actinomycetospora soli]|uniref:DUF1707 SHOCT-like domain-containing protein n=1 Tax=Actinomycetospora soli TaxID=2893887 RepID=UPI001E3EB0B2|nr:DUF1707 domain-containing protein [Actinomycetospora soli]MCD2190191.1 DUF1707 domain-containing protein [Actinomycetospora soli]